MSLGPRAHVVPSCNTVCTSWLPWGSEKSVREGAGQGLHTVEMGLNPALFCHGVLPHPRSSINENKPPWIELWDPGPKYDLTYEVFSCVVMVMKSILGCVLALYINSPTWWHCLKAMVTNRKDHLQMPCRCVLSARPRRYEQGMSGWPSLPGGQRHTSTGHFESKGSISLVFKNKKQDRML